MSGIQDVMISYLEPAMRAITTDAKGKGPTTPASGKAAVDVDRVMGAIMPQVAPKVSASHSEMAAKLNANYNKAMREIMPIGFDKLPGNVQAEAHIARDNSIKLVENAARSYAGAVRDMFNDPSVTAGLRWEDLRDKLLETGDVWESRAELIARDQTLKLNGAINRSRQQAAGVTSYVWSTSGDERVRDTHAELDGKTFDWGAPPEPGNPGEDFQCRCVALPIIADLQEEFGTPGQRPDED
jgi:SPP1 gp7 family putative phage head morphogenesis protein